MATLRNRGEITAPPMHQNARQRLGTGLAVDSFIAPRALSLNFSVRPNGAVHQWRKDPPKKLSEDLVADERLGWVTGRVEARDKGRLGRLSNPTGRNANEA